MKLSLPNSALLPAVSALRGLIQTGQPIPAAAHLLFRQLDDAVTITATDLEIEMVYRIKGHAMSEPGEAMVSAHKLASISTISDENDVISLICSENQTEIEGTNSHFKLASLPPDQFPNLEDPSDAATRFEVRGDDLHHLLAKTDFSMAQGDARYYLNGMLLAIEGENLLAVATDGHRLAVCRLGNKSKAEKEARVILPRRAVQELKRTLPQTEEMVSISAGEKQICVRFGVITMTTKLLEGSKYPDYKRVMPDDFAHVISLNNEALRQTLGKAKVVEEGATRFCFSENKLKVISRSDQDEAEVEQEIEYTGQAFEVGFNPQYLWDVLGAIESEQVLFEFKDPNSAVQIRESDSEAAKYIVMPLRL